ncbi:MAG: electron transport complex subunit RsxG [Chromatiales bacterium]|jgi:electron transport complex protein RnfG
MIRSKQILFTGALLMLFAIVGGAMVGMTYEGTAERIAENERQAMLRNLNQILPHSEYDNDLLQDTLTLPADERLGQQDPSTAYVAKKDGRISAIIFSVIAPDGYSGEIRLLVGIRASGNIAGVRVIKHNETPGLGDAIETQRSNWVTHFDGRSLQNPSGKGWAVKRDGGVFDQFTGATITPRAVVNAVHQTLIYFDRHRPQLLKQPEAPAS